MDVIALCPARVATGGTEAIHQLVAELNKYLDAVILYPGDDSDPQPPQYEHYGVRYIKTYPTRFKGVVIFPEIWGNNVCNNMFSDAVKVINWAGVDVYDWHTPPEFRGLYLKAKDAIHIAQSAYAVDTLTRRGVKTILRLSDIIGAEFFESFQEEPRNDVVLYNPAKITPFERKVINAAPLDFKPIMNMSRADVIDTLRHGKLYIDFNVFSGRERLLREAVMCGCCALVSNSGCSAYFEDISITDRYKFEMIDWNVNAAVEAMTAILDDYEAHDPEFDVFRKAIISDQERFPDDVKAIAEAFKERL